MTPDIIESTQVDGKATWRQRRHDRWYVVQTNPQLEHKAADELRRAGLRVYLPKRSYVVRNRRSRDTPAVRFRPLLIGYLFVRFPASMIDRYGNPQFGIVRECQGVRGYVRAAASGEAWEPFGVPDDAVKDFIRRQRRREFGRPAVLNPRQRLAELRKTFKPGSEVRVTDGPFLSFLATLERLNTNMTADLTLSLFGRATPVRLEIGQFEITRLDREREAA